MLRLFFIASIPPLAPCDDLSPDVQMVQAAGTAPAYAFACIGPPTPIEGANGMGAEGKCLHTPIVAYHHCAKSLLSYFLNLLREMIKV